MGSLLSTSTANAVDLLPLDASLGVSASKDTVPMEEWEVPTVLPGSTATPLAFTVTVKQRKTNKRYILPHLPYHTHSLSGDLLYKSGGVSIPSLIDRLHPEHIQLSSLVNYCQIIAASAA